MQARRDSLNSASISLFFAGLQGQQWSREAGYMITRTLFPGVRSGCLVS